MSMATHRAMQARGMTVTASRADVGPYALADLRRPDLRRTRQQRPTMTLTLLVAAYQRAYGDLYSTPGDVFEPQYASGIESLLPTTEARVLWRRVVCPLTRCSVRLHPPRPTRT